MNEFEINEINILQQKEKIINLINNLSIFKIKIYDDNNNLYNFSMSFQGSADDNYIHSSSDYNTDDEINLKSYDDSFASAANYINKLGWNPDEPCYLKVDLKDNIPISLLNYSAKSITNKKKLKDMKKYIKNSDSITFNDNLIVAIITPDKEIVENPNPLHPAFIVFKNYELILKWNRSLRFGLAVCTLKNKFKNAL